MEEEEEEGYTWGQEDPALNLCSTVLELFTLLALGSSVN